MFTTSNVMGRVGLAAVLAVGAIVIDVVADQKPVGAVIDPNICYVVPDRGGGNGGDDRLVTFDRSTGVFAPIGAGTGTFNIEAAEVWPVNDTIYAINANELGIIDRTTGVYSTIGPSFGTLNGAAGAQNISDADGMTIDPYEGFIWAAERNRGPDYIFKIDRETGVPIKDAFGAGIDYVVSTPAVASSPDLDDIAMNPATGELFGIANSGSSVPSQRLVKIDKVTGAQTLVGQLGEADMEGLTLTPFGVMFGTDGTNNKLFEINQFTGAATNGRPIPIGSDYESVSCMTGPPNQILGTVFFDADSNGIDDGADTPQPGAVVNLIIDTNGNGIIDPGEVTVGSMTTAVDGSYQFDLAAQGNFIVQIVNPSLPDGAINTTPKTLAVSLPVAGTVVPDQDFGFFAPPPPPPPPPLSIDKSNDPVGVVAGGDTVTYTIVVTNNSDVPQTGVDIQDSIPPGVTYVPDSTKVILPGEGVVLNYRDEFTAAESYAGGDGSLSWAGPWVETGDNNDAKDGEVRVDNSDCPTISSGDSCLRFDTQDPVSVARGADLSTALSPTLAYAVFAKEEIKDGSTVKVEVTGDGTNWTTLATYTETNPGKDNEIAESFQIPGNAVTSSFQVRVIHDGVGDVGKHQFDDFDISWTDPSAPSPQAVLDEFTVAEVYTGDDGSKPWAGPWVEIGDNDDAKDGDISVRDDGACDSIPSGSLRPCVRYDAKDDVNSLERPVDLSAAIAPVTLSYGWFNKGEFKDGQLVLEVSGDGTTFTPLVTYDDTNAPKDGTGSESFTLDPSVLTANFTLRWRSELVGGALDFAEFFMDDFRIAWSEPSGGDGGPPPALLGTIPPPTLAPGQSVIITFAVTIDAAENFFTMQNVAEASSNEQPIPVSDNVANTLAPASADLEVTKTLDPPNPNIGDPVTYVVTLTNNGPDTATGVKINESPPPVLAATFLPSEGTEYDVNNNQWSVPLIASGESTTLVIIGAANASGDYSNTAAITASEADDPNPSNNTATVVAEVPPTADLSIDKELVGGPAFFAGDPIEFNVVLTNDGPDAATNVTIEDAIPGAGASPAITPTLGTYAGTTWTIPSIDPGTTATLNVVGVATGNGDFTNTAEVTASDQVDLDSTPNDGVPEQDDQDSVDFQVVDTTADLAVTKVADVTTFEVGEIVTFTIEVTNNGPDDATNIEIAEALGPEFSDDSIVLESLGTYASSIDTWFIDELTVGSTATLTIEALAISAGPVTNTASVQAIDQNDPDPTNDEQSVDLTIDPATDSDGDGIPNYLDIDDDNDGILDIVEVGADPANPVDTDGDMIPDYLDIDSDNDGVPDVFEAQGGDPATFVPLSGVDADMDGLDDAFDADPTDPDPTPSVGTTPANFDDDAYPNHLDIDADDDGITDLVESFPPGSVPTGVDADMDGLDDAFDNVDVSVTADPVNNSNGSIPVGNLDGTGGSNFVDIDADDDGITDLVESHTDGAVTSPTGVDLDMDGLDDAYDADTDSNDPVDSVGTTPPNTDSTGSFDFLDIDADDDGIPDNVEGQPTNTYVAPTGSDADGDGLDDAYDDDNASNDPTDSVGVDPENTDGADDLDYRDTDSDNDGLDDTTESDRGTATGADLDMDGLDDGFDANPGDPDPTDGITTPNNDAGLPDTDGDVATEDVDYRDVRPAEIGDFVWLDLNGDGIQDAGEPGVEGVVVALLDINGGPVLDAGGAAITATTDAAGAYTMMALANVVYSVEVQDPTSSYAFSPLDSSGDDATDSDVDGTGLSAPFTPAPGPNPNVGDAGILPAQIGDLVFFDANGDGIRDAGDAGLPAIAIELLDAAGAPVLDAAGDPVAATTDADGEYVFTVLPGDYQIRVTPPTGASFSAIDQGGDDATDSDVDPATGTTATFTAVSGENFDVGDAGILAATLGDFVFLDLNADGIQDGGEAGLEGITVNLLDDAGAVIDTATTDENGAYLFAGVAPGVPVTVQVVDAGLQFSPPDVGGDDAVDSDVNSTGGVTVTPVSGSNGHLADVGVLPATLGNFVFVDLNADGIQDAGEPGLEGVVVELLDPAGDVLDTATTDPAGAYLFSVPPGDYQLRITPKPGATIGDLDQGGDDLLDSDFDPTDLTTAPFTAPSGDNTFVGDAAINPALIEGTVFFDTNDNGAEDASDPGIEGVTVNLLGASGDQVGTTTTDSSGDYSFVDLEPGVDYTVQIVPPPGSTFADPDQGGDATDSDVDVTTGEVTVTPPSGGTPNTADAGIRPATLDGTIWLDSNEDGANDPDEPPVAGRTVNVLDANGVIIGTAVTDENGDYTIGALPPSIPLIVELVPLAGADLTALDQGDDATDSDFDPGTSQVVVTLVSGDNAGPADGGVLPATLSDIVFLDVDDSKTETPGDRPLAGIVVNLLGAGGEIVDTTITGPDGRYEFTDVIPGVQAIIEIVVPGQSPTVTDPDQGGDDTVDSDVDPTTGRLAITPISGVDTEAGAAGVRPASIGDFVFLDLDLDGIQDAGEPGIEGVGVSVLHDTGTEIATATTDADGRWEVFGLQPAADFTVVLTPAPGAEFVAPGQGSDPALDSDAAADGTIAVTTSKPQNLDEADAGIVPAIIEGTIFIDRNGDGINDPDDPGAPDLTVNIIDTNGDVIATTATDVDGNYTVPGLLPGVEYTVEVVSPGSAEISPPNIGTDETVDSDIDPTTGQTTITPSSGPNSGTTDGGVSAATVAGRTWADSNGDGVLDPTEVFLPNVPVDLVDSGVVVATTTTGVDGSYLFAGVVPGDYTVRVDPSGVPGVEQTGDPDGTLDDSTPITVVLGESLSRLDFGYEPEAVIAGVVFADLDGDGIQDPGEPGIDGAELEIVDADGNVVTVTTDADGAYTTPVRPGSATVTIDPDTITPGYVNTTSNVTQTVDAAAGSTTTADPIGYLPQASLSGSIFFDVDADGERAPGDREPNLSAVVVELVDPDGNVVATATTDSSGAYVFADIPAGDYNARVDPLSLPNGLTQQTADPDCGDLSGAELRFTVDDNGISRIAGDLALSRLGGATTLDGCVFGFSGTASIGDLVFLDSNGNGVPDAGEPGLGGVAMATTWAGFDGVFGTDDDITYPSVTSDAGGGYLFDSLPSGVYRVVVDPTTLPDGVAQTTALQFEFTVAPGAEFRLADIGLDALPLVIPETGSNTRQPLTLGALLIALGAALLLIQRRRRWSGAPLV